MTISRSVRATPKSVRTKVLGFGEEGHDATDHGTISYVLVELRTKSVEFDESNIGVVRIEKRKVLRHTVFEDEPLARKLLDEEDERRRAEEDEAQRREEQAAGVQRLDDALTAEPEPEPDLNGDEAVVEGMDA